MWAGAVEDPQDVTRYRTYLISTVMPCVRSVEVFAYYIVLFPGDKLYPWLHISEQVADSNGAILLYNACSLDTFKHKVGKESVTFLFTP